MALMVPEILTERATRATAPPPAPEPAALPYQHPPEPPPPPVIERTSVEVVALAHVAKLYPPAPVEIPYGPHDVFPLPPTPPPAAAAPPIAPDASAPFNNKDPAITAPVVDLTINGNVPVTRTVEPAGIVKLVKL